MLNITISVMLVMNLLSCELTLFYLPFFRISTCGMASSFCGKLGWASKLVRRHHFHVMETLVDVYIYNIYLIQTYMYV